MNRSVGYLLAECAIYRAVYLELVSSLSTDCFILAVRRFIARRRCPSTVYSDSGKNLIGTANLLKNIDWEKVEDFPQKRDFHGNSILHLLLGGVDSEKG